MSLKGNLEPSFLSGLFQIFCDEEKTGLFRACYDNTQMEIYIQKGTIVYAASFNKTHRLCDILLQQGLLQPDQIKNVNTVIEQSGKTVGRTLLDLEYLDETQIKTSVKELIIDLLLNLFRQTSGEFEFQDTPLDADKLLLVPVSMRQVILEISRMLDELEAFEKKLPNKNMVFGLYEKSQQNASYQVDAIQWRILSFVHAQHTIETIIKESCCNIHTVYKTLNDLMDAKMIKPLQDREKDISAMTPSKKEAASPKEQNLKGKPKGKGLFGFFGKKSDG